MKEINIRKKKEAIEELTKFKNKKYTGMDVRLVNTNLRVINKNIKTDIFDKNDLFVLSDTLYAIMSSLDEKVEQHHPHGLTPEALLEALCNLQYSKEVYRSYDLRYEIITTTLFGKKAKVIIEKNAALVENLNANINKLVTLYPTD